MTLFLVDAYFPQKTCYTEGKITSWWFLDCLQMTQKYQQQKQLVKYYVCNAKKILKIMSHVIFKVVLPHIAHTFLCRNALNR